MATPDMARHQVVLDTPFAEVAQHARHVHPMCFLGQLPEMERFFFQAAAGARRAAGAS
jgi:hypothetical protein